MLWDKMITFWFQSWISFFQDEIRSFPTQTERDISGKSVRLCELNPFWSIGRVKLGQVGKFLSRVMVFQEKRKGAVHYFASDRGLEDFGCVTIKLPSPLPHWFFYSYDPFLLAVNWRSIFYSPLFILSWRRRITPLVPLKTMWSQKSSIYIPHSNRLALRASSILKLSVWFHIKLSPTLFSYLFIIYYPTYVWFFSVKWNSNGRIYLETRWT